MNEKLGLRIWEKLRHAKHKQNISPVLNQIEIEEILKTCQVQFLGARRERPKEAYEVWRIAPIGSAVIELVRLKRSTAYERHRHNYSKSTLQIACGEGHLVEGEGDFEPYVSGAVFEVPPRGPHGFFTIDETYFISLNDPAIAAHDGHVDIEFLDKRNLDYNP